MRIIYKAAGIIIKDKKLLVARSRSKPAFLAPGGKIDADESPTQSLKRELKEEFGIDCNESDFEYFDTFTADAINDPGQQVKMDIYLVKKYSGEPTPSNEIDEQRWITTADMGSILIGSIFAHEVMPRLKTQGLIS